MSNLGFHNLFHHIGSFFGIRAVRFFYERDGLFSPDENPYTARTGMNELSGYDAIFFTVSFELDYINIIRALRLSSIPPLRADRNNTGPLVICGGIAPTANPEVLSQICDIIYLGDMECGLGEMLSSFMRFSFRKGNELFREIVDIPGVLVTGMRMKGGSGGDTGRCGRKDVEGGFTRSFLRKLDEPAHSVVISGETEFSNMLLVEIVRGCRGSCKFCMTRCVNAPVRNADALRVVEIVREYPGVRRVGLIAPVLTDHPDLHSIVRSINRIGPSVSFSSLRADDFNEETANLLVKNGQNAVTFAPETSWRLRNRIGKKLTDEMLLEAVGTAVDHNIRRIRFYLMYGLPGETMEDMEAVAGLIRKAYDMIRAAGGNLVLSVNPFVPKKNTPFSGFRLFPPAYYREVQDYLKHELGTIKGITAKFESLKKLYVHYYLSIGNSDVGPLLCRCVEKGTMRRFREMAGEATGL